MSTIPPHIKARWEYLVTTIRFHDYLYYQVNAPLVSNTAYDRLRQELVSLENQYPELHTLGSPSQEVGFTPDPHFVTRAHLIPVYSLDNVFDLTQLEAFIHRTKRFLGMAPSAPMTWIAEPKIDGLTVVLRYQQGVLVQAATRGDGIQGEDITANIRTLAGLPTHLKGNGWPSVFEVRGEVYMLKADFQRLNTQREDLGLPLFSNPRNAAAGSLRQLDPQVTAQRPLHFLMHGFSSFPTDTYSAAMHRLEEGGLPYPHPSKICASDEEIVEYLQWMRDNRHKIPYEIDGAVFKVDRLDWQERLGYSARAPRFAIAYKFPAPQGITQIEKIDIQVGRTGVLTPVAHLTPVSVGGVTIARATLHNEDEIRRKDIRPGDTVIIQRAGEVIPQVLAVCLDKRPDPCPPFEFPTQCPQCGSPALRIAGQAARRCTGGLICTAQQVWHLRHFVSRQAFDIDGLGIKHLQTLWQHQWVMRPPDLFTLWQKRDLLIALPGWGAKSVDNVLQAIENKRTISLPRFIYALGIPQVGETTAKTLAIHYETIERWMNSMYTSLPPAYEELLSIEGIGPIIAQEISTFFQNASQYQTVKTLTQYVQVTPYLPSSPKASAFAGKTLVFTGTLHHMTRSEAKQWAEKLGAVLMSTVSSHTDYVVAGENPGSKLRQAVELGITILDEATWRQMAQLEVTPS